ncbi:MAG: InlB B-repeat-containing protein, partial [Clostridia bacterium]|nr:InlB B-repeat-containing protein [Clostridia bacterium]
IDGTDGTTVLKTETVEEGGYATEWTPEKDGYNFVGWYGEPSFTHSFDFTTAITADTSVFAAFSSAVTVTDTRDFYIVGSGTSPVLSKSDWGNVISDDFKLTKASDTNEYTITLDLYAGDYFQFAINSSWEDQRGFGYLTETALSDGTTVFSSSGTIGDNSSKRLNIKVEYAGNYTLTLTTYPADDTYESGYEGNENYNINPYDTITWVRNGDASEEVEATVDFYIKGATITNWQDMYNASTKMTESTSGVYTLSIYLKAGEEFMFTSTNTLAGETTTGATYIKASNLDDASKTYVSGDENNITALASGTYTFTYTASTEVLSVAFDATVVPDTYDYYIDGTVTASSVSWTGITSLQLTETTSGSGIYALSNVELTAGDEIIVRAIVAGSTVIGDSWENSKATYNYTYLSGGGSNFSTVSDTNSNISVLTSGTYNIFFDSYSKIITISSGYDVYLSGNMQTDWNPTAYNDTYLFTKTADNTYEYTIALAVGGQFGLRIYNAGDTSSYTWIGTGYIGTTGDANDSLNAQYNYTCTTAGVYKVICVYDGTNCTVDIYNTTYDIYIKGGMNSWDHNFSSSYKLTASTSDATVFEITLTFESGWELGLALYESGATEGYGDWIGLSNLGTTGDANSIFTVESGNLTCNTAGTYKVTYNAVSGEIDFYAVS